jgi:hypothetical protein
MNSATRKSKAQLLVDGGDPQETLRVKNVVGYVDGQTTNPTLVAKNPGVRTIIGCFSKALARWSAKITLVDPLDEEIVFDMLSTTDESKYEKFDRQPAYLLFSRDISTVDTMAD